MFSVPEGRTANQPLLATTFKPPIGALLAGARVSDEVLRHKRAHGMADEHDWQARMVGGDALVQPPEIIDAFAPAVPLGKEAEILQRRGRPAMAAMIAGIDRIASASQRLGKPGVSAGMLDEAMGNLHHRLRRCLRPVDDGG